MGPTGLPERGERPLDSRAIRKRGLLRFVDDDVAAAIARTDVPTAVRLRRVNGVAATAFAIGGTLFAVGAALAQIAEAAPTVVCTVYLVGGCFFSTGGYASVLQAVNGPRELGGDGRLAPVPWRWWASEPGRLAWMSAASLFVGTLVFAINIVDSFIGGLPPTVEDRLVWSPDVVGCLLFLISGHLAMREIGQDRSFWRRRRDLGWWIVAVNQLGSVLFMASAIGSFVRPATGAELSVGIANWGTLTGALCFAVAGVMQEGERPQAPSRQRRPRAGGGPRSAPRHRAWSRRRSPPRARG